MTKRSKATGGAKRGRMFAAVDEFNMLAGMERKESRFFPHKRPSDLGSIRRIALRLGMQLMMRYTPEDTETQEPGTRMWVVLPAKAKSVEMVKDNLEDNEL